MLTMHPKRIAVEPLYDPDEAFAGGLIITPDTAKERCDQGIVKYIGGDCKYLKVGDHVLFSGYAGDLVSIEGEGTLIIMDERFVKAIIHDEPKDIPGLFFRDKEGNYFAATSEQATYLIARALENDPTVRPSRKPGINKLSGAPTVEEYNEPDEDD
jgi:co-chaperonin GroES (HSP10)